jgi:hypothetical protein
MNRNSNADLLNVCRLRGATPAGHQPNSIFWRDSTAPASRAADRQAVTLCHERVPNNRLACQDDRHVSN